MRQAYRILFIYIAIIGIAYALLYFLPIHFQPKTLNFISDHKIIVTQQDSIESINLNAISNFPKDSIPSIDSLRVKRDTVITALHLSCPTQFIDGIKQLDTKLSQAHLNNEIIRVLHFGDSQIEGDRITAYIRESFQDRFGGSGPGLISVLDPQHINPSIWLGNNDNWKLNTIYDRNRDKTKNSYGLIGQYAELPAQTEGIIKISKSPWAEKHASNYQRIRLFIAPHADSILIKGKIKKTEVIDDKLPSSANLTEINWEFPQVSPSLQLQIKSQSELAVLGCALDSTSGVAVDNLALRGQSSPLLHRTNTDLFKAMGEHLNIGMVMIQFGTNMIPIETKNYGFYQKILAHQFDLIKEYLPEIPVMIIGVADAAHSSNGKVQSYKHLTYLRDAQKELALQYGFAYFDLYEAMGGEGSIITWSKSDPTLALTDYIHFTREGGKRAADYVVKALWKQFDNLYFEKAELPGIDSTAWNNY